MKKLLYKYAALLLLSCCITAAVQAQTKASERNMTAELARIKAMQTENRDIVAKMRRNGHGNGNQPTLPPTANPGGGGQNPNGKKPSQQPMQPIPPRKVK